MTTTLPENDVFDVCVASYSHKSNAFATILTFRSEKKEKKVDSLFKVEHGIETHFCLILSFTFPLRLFIYQFTYRFLVCHRFFVSSFNIVFHHDDDLCNVNNNNDNNNNEMEKQMQMKNEILQILATHQEF